MNLVLMFEKVVKTSTGCNDEQLMSAMEIGARLAFAALLNETPTHDLSDTKERIAKVLEVFEQEPNAEPSPDRNGHAGAAHIEHETLLPGRL